MFLPIPHVRTLVGWLICHNFLKGQEVAFPCSNRRPCESLISKPIWWVFDKTKEVFEITVSYSSAKPSVINLHLFLMAIKTKAIQLWLLACLGTSLFAQANSLFLSLPHARDTNAVKRTVITMQSLWRRHFMCLNVPVLFMTYASFLLYYTRNVTYAMRTIL